MDVVASLSKAQSPARRLSKRSPSQDELPRLAMPVLLLFGADDRIIDPSSAEVWAEQVPDIRVVLLPGVGHAPMLEVPRSTARSYRDFLRRVAP